MTESTTYQWILEEGQGLGIIQGEQTALLTLLEERFGSVPPQVEERIRASNDPGRLQAAIRQAIRIATPDELRI